MDAADMDEAGGDEAGGDEARMKMTEQPTTASVADGARSTDQAP
jgi:hypothetical protein